jgi:hypothetical protein
MEMPMEVTPKRGDPGWEQYRACTRKARYAEAPTGHAGWFRSYRCKFCDGWHLTSKPRTGSLKHELTARDTLRRTTPTVME